MVHICWPKRCLLYQNDQPRSKVILRHVQQEFGMISSEVFLFSPFFACQEKPVIRIVTGGYPAKYYGGWDGFQKSRVKS